MFNVLALVLALAQPTPAPAVTPQQLPTITVSAPNAKLTLQVARTEPQRNRGLMAYTSLAPHTGMVFVFDRDGEVAFWMKDTLIPLDMIFVGDDGVVRAVDANVAVVSPDLPDVQIPIEEGSARYVIELNAGEAAADGIKAGVLLHGVSSVK